MDDPTKFGVVETDKDGRVICFTEKPKWEDVRSHWINAGVYILEPKVLDYIPDDTFYMFEKGVFPEMLANGEPVYAYASDAYWIDMGTPEKYHQINNDMLSGKCTSPLHKTEPVIIGHAATVHKSAKIKGPVMLGDGCRIEENVELTGPVILGKDCHIQKASRISNSVLWDNIVVGEGGINY